MDPGKVFCHNPDCPARGKSGRGNIGIHSRKKRRYICHVQQPRDLGQVQADEIRVKHQVGIP